MSDLKEALDWVRQLADRHNFDKHEREMAEVLARRAVDHTDKLPKTAARQAVEQVEKV